MKSKILIGNIPADTSENLIRDLVVSKIGDILSISLPQDPKTRKNRGFAIVEVSQDAQAVQAVNDLNGFCLDGRLLAITIQTSSRESRKWYQFKH